MADARFVRPPGGDRFGPIIQTLKRLATSDRPPGKELRYYARRSRTSCRLTVAGVLQPIQAWLTGTLATRNLALRPAALLALHAPFSEVEFGVLTFGADDLVLALLPGDGADLEHFLHDHRGGGPVGGHER